VSAIPTVLLAALRDYRDGDKILKTLTNLSDLVRVLFNKPSGADAFLALYRYISNVAKDCGPEAIDNTFIEIDPSAENQVMNAAQILEQRGFEKGKLEGKLEGQAQVLVRLLVRRFSQLPHAINNRLSGATAEQLELWTDRILFADRIDAVFTEK
jgi:hypothetical protein